MSTQINSPFMLSKLRPIEEMSADENNYHAQLERIIQQIYRRIGGSIDNNDEIFQLIDSLENSLSFLTGYAWKLNAGIEDLESENNVHQFNLPRWYEVSISAAHTAIDNEELNVTQGAPITMPTSGRVKVNNIDGSTVPVYMSGSQTIFGESIVLIESKGSVVFKYLPESDQWVFE